MNRAVGFATAGVAFLVVSTLGAAPQSSPSEDAGRRDVVTDRISVTVVEIPVQVLLKGEPVHGLGPEDFVVLDRGVPQEIVSFDVLDLSTGETRAAPEDGAAGGQGAASSRRVRHFLVLLDVDLTDWRELPRAVRGAREMLADQLHPSDRVAVGFYSSFFGLQMLTTFDADRSASLEAVGVIEAMVERSPERTADRLVRLAELSGLTYDGEAAPRETWERVARQWITRARQPAGGSPARGFADAIARDAQSRNLGYSEGDLDRVRANVEAVPDYYDEPAIRQVRELGRRLGELAREMAHVPDPKHVLFLSQGFPSRLVEDRNQSTRVLFRLETAVKAFVETGWTLQAIDVRGVPSIDEPVFDGNSLFHLAEHTGGRLWENFNRIGVATERLLERTSVTYLLVIQPDVEADGSYHRLEVRLAGDRPGKLSFRPGYRAPLPGDRRARLDSGRDLAQLILEGRELDDFDIELLAMQVPALGGRTRVPVVVEIPGEVLLENPFGDTASLEVHAYGLDSANGIQDLFIKRLDFDLAREAKRLARGGVRVVGHLELGLGENEVRVLVKNLADDALSLRSARLRLERVASGELRVLEPIFVDHTRDWLSVQLTEGSRLDDVVATLAGVGETFFPRLRPAFRAKQMQRLVLNLFFETEETPLLDLRILTARGEELAKPKIRLIERHLGPGGATGLVATLHPKGLEPGGYLVEVSLVDPSSGERASRSTRFRIEESS